MAKPQGPPPYRLQELSPAEQDTVSVDQLSRMLFRWLRDRQPQPQHFGTARQDLCGLPARKPTPRFEQALEDAWFRLVDRNLIRWSSGDELAGSYYQITERGRSSRYHEGVIEDPDPTIASIEQAIGVPLDDVAKQYLREAIATFSDRHLVASQFCLGAVAERVAMMVRDWLVSSTFTSGKLESAEHIKVIIDLSVAALEQVPRGHPRRDEASELREAMASCAHVYRKSRNDAGHPASVLKVDEDELALMITAMRRRYIPTVYKALSQAL